MSERNERSKSIENHPTYLKTNSAILMKKYKGEGVDKIESELEGNQIANIEELKLLVQKKTTEMSQKSKSDVVLRNK